MRTAIDFPTATALPKSRRRSWQKKFISRLFTSRFKNGVTEPIWTNRTIRKAANTQGDTDDEQGRPDSSKRFGETMRSCTHAHPRPDHFLRGYGGSNPTYHIGDRDDLYVKQWLGTVSVGIDVRGAFGADVRGAVGADVRGAVGADVEALMAPYRERFEQEFADDYAGE